VDVRGGKKAIVVFVPVPQLKAFHKVQARYVLSWSRRPTQPGTGTGGILAPVIMFTYHSFLGLLVSWRRNSPTVMLFSWRNVGSSASRPARRASNKSDRVAGL
jgi:hypothetical protein